MIGLEGGWFSGKTYIGARKLTALHMLNAIDIKGEITCIPSAVVAPSYSNILDFAVPAVEQALNEMNLSWRWLGVGSASKGQYSGPAIIVDDFGTHTRPSVIFFRTAENPRKITGWTVGAAWGDEPSRWKESYDDPVDDALLQLLARVRHPKARILQALFTYTNEGDSTRIHEEMTSGKEGIKLYRTSTKDNPIASDFYERQKEFLSKELAEQYLEGKAISLKGKTVYYSFDPNKHINEKLKLIKDRPLHLSLDFNIAPGMHAEIGQYFPEEDMMTVVYEIHDLRMSVRELVPSFISLIKKSGGWQYPKLEIYGDATGWSETASTGESCYEILKNGLDKYNIPYIMKVSRRNPAVIDRLNTFNVALEDINGSFHWQCHPRCERLINDMKKCKRKKDGELDKTNPELFHASDAEGYRVYLLRPIRLPAPQRGKFDVAVH